jgi:hypothetical protein
MLIDKSKIKGLDMTSVEIRLSKSDYELSVGIIQEYIFNKELISSILSTKEIIACHRYYLNMHYQFVHIVNIPTNV